MSGGVAQNIKANKLIAELKDLNNLFIPPGPGDESISIGAAFLEYISRTNKVKSLEQISGYLGPSFSEEYINKVIKDKLSKEFTCTKANNKDCAKILAKGEVIARFSNDKMEFGARLKEIRISLNCSQKELSEQTGLNLRTIQRIENNEVKPSLYSLKVIGEASNTDLSDFIKTSEAKPYEFNVNLKITDMNQFLNDLKALVKTHWKTIFIIILVIYLFTSYTDIKSGIMDAWSGK